MPNIRDLMEHADDEGEDADGKPPADITLRAVQRAMQPFVDAERERHNWASQQVLASISAEARIKNADRMALAESQAVSKEARDLAIQHQQELARLRKESNAAALKYFLLGVAVTALSVFIGWLLSP